MGNEQNDGAERHVEYDLPVMLDGTVDSVVAKLGEQSDGNLQALIALEKHRENPRTTLIAAIEREIEARREQAEGEANAKIAAAREAGEKAREAEVQDLRDQLEAMRKTVDQLEEAAKLPPAPPEETEFGTRDLVLDARAGEATGIVFATADHRTIAELPALQFGEGAFDATTDGVALDRDVTIDGKTLPRVQIGEIWLIDAEGRGKGVFRLRVPLAVGGGQSAAWRKGDLRFTILDGDKDADAPEKVAA